MPNSKIIQMKYVRLGLLVEYIFVQVFILTHILIQGFLCFSETYFKLFLLLNHPTPFLALLDLLSREKQVLSPSQITTSSTVPILSKTGPVAALQLCTSVPSGETKHRVYKKSLFRLIVLCNCAMGSRKPKQQNILMVWGFPAPKIPGQS